MNHIKKNYSLIICLLIGFCSKAQQGCDLNAIRAAMTTAGCSELASCQSSCSMYFYNPQSQTGTAAQQFAESLGANLISVQTAAENSCISSALVSNGFGGTIWIGFTDENSEGTYYWYDGSPVVFTNWNGGEPNNSGGNEDCTQIFPNGLWNDLNCNGGGSKSVIEVSLCPQITASNDTSICNTTSANLVCSDATFGSPPYAYNWSNGQTGQNVTVSPTTTTTYTVTATDRYGCFVTEDIIVSVVENVTASFTSSNYCVYEGVEFIDNSTVVSPDVISNSGWDFGDASQDIGNQVTHQYTSAGTYVVSHAVSTVNGCTGTAIENITVYDAPIADFNFLDACANESIDFEDNSAGAGTTVINWEWDFADGSSPGSNGTESHTYTNSGSYDVQLIVEDNEGCRDTALQAVTIFEDPTAGFNFSDVCLYDTVNFIDASTITTPDNIVSWSWDINNNGLEDYSTQNANHKFSSPGSYDVILSVVSNNNCSNSITETVNIFPVPQASFSASTVCVNGAATDFVNTSTLSQGNIVMYGWNFGDGNFSTQENPINNYQIASSYPVTLGVVSDLGCADSVTFSIEVLGKPSAAYSQDTTNGCPPLCVAFTDTSYDDVPILEWNWKFESSYGESSDQNPTHCYETTGDYDVGLIVKNSQGCKDTLEQIALISVYPQPTSDFSLTPTSTDVLNSTVDFTNNSIDAAAWIWDFGDGTEENLTDYNPSHLYADTGNLEVQLVVINSFLCSDTSYQMVEILPVDELFVPSAFSPNGDGKNDVLYARGYIGVMYFAVFDRLGKKVFESEDKETGWDGLINGKNALEGVYSWYLQAEVNGNAYKLKGDVTLVR
jgi:gliding motility-associated-like protein